MLNFSRCDRTEYEVDRKKISLKNKRDNFYILNNELVDNSFEISNISFTSKDLIDTHHIMTLIIKS